MATPTPYKRATNAGRDQRPQSVRYSRVHTTLQRLADRTKTREVPRLGRIPARDPAVKGEHDSVMPEILPDIGGVNCHGVEARRWNSHPVAQDLHPTPGSLSSDDRQTVPGTVVDEVAEWRVHVSRR